MDARSTKYSHAKGVSRDDLFVIREKESKVLTIPRKISRPGEAGIRTSSKLTNIGVSLFSIAERSLVFQQMPRSPLSLAGILDKYKYCLKDRGTVLAFLKEHQNVANFLIEAHEKIREYFSSNILQLRVSQDPEDPQLKLLVLSVVAKPDEVDESYEKFTALEDDLFLDDFSEVSDYLCIKLDFE